MVGVAGKSRGCNTCRSRKVKCDAQRPSCGVCLKTGRLCGGYERWPVFINRTSNGLEKRSRLAEVKQDDASTESHSQLSSHADTTDEQIAQPRVSRQIKSPDDVIQWFAISSLFSNRGTRMASFMIPIISIRVPDTVLYASLLAVSTMQLGRTTGDKGAVVQAHNLYSKSLRQLQKALNDTERSREDDTLASAVVLCTFEVLQGVPAYDTPGWQKHVDGIATILKHRGPAVCRSFASRAIFEHCRDLFMLQALLERKASAFASRAWLTEPWSNVQKSRHQLLRDSGLILTELIQQADTLATSSHYDLSDVEELVVSCEHLYHSMSRQHDDCHETWLNERPNCNQWYIDCILSRVFRLICCTITCNALRQAKYDWGYLSSPGTTNDDKTRVRLSHEIVVISEQVLPLINGLENRACVRWALTQALEHLDLSDTASTQCKTLIQELQDNVSWMSTSRPSVNHVDRDILCIFYPYRQKQ